MSTGLYDGLQRRSHLETTPQGPVFVYISEDDFQPDVMPCKQESRLVWHSKEGYIYAYDSGQQVEMLQSRTGLYAEEEETQ